jgi:hypothetical protein
MMAKAGERAKEKGRGRTGMRVILPDTATKER